MTIESFLARKVIYQELKVEHLENEKGELNIKLTHADDELAELRIEVGRLADGQVDLKVKLIEANFEMARLDNIINHRVGTKKR